MARDMLQLGRYGSGRAAYTPDIRHPRSVFARRFGYTTTFNCGQLIPVCVDEVLPGDTVRMDPTLFGRLATPLLPLMSNLYLSTFWFFVPCRLVWDNWEKFNGAQANPDDPVDFLTPVIDPADLPFASESLADYFGLPTLVDFGADTPVQAMPFRVYNLTWNEWFRDQNLQDSVLVNKGDGPDSLSDYVVLRRNKYHDYFTGSLPWPQKGNAVELPLGTSAPVDWTPAPATGHTAADATVRNVVESAVAGRGMELLGASGASSQVTFDSLGTWTADLTTATAVTVNALRQAMQVQQLYERDARGGTRYTEILLHHFGVVSPDFRLQRPEYLGGGRTPININPVAQTSEAGTTPQGNLSAFGTVVAQHGFAHSFTEHGWLLGLVSVDADLSYQQGVHRMWSRRAREEYYWPSFAQLGEQEVLNREIYVDGTATDQLVFGYQERFAEYRYAPSKITGQIRSNFPQSLDAYVLTEDFASQPVLNSEFITSDPPVDRVIATPTYPHITLDSWFDARWARRMPMYGVPASLGRF